MYNEITNKEKHLTEDSNMTSKKTRTRVFVQVFDHVSHKWCNYISKPTYEEAEAFMRELNVQFPNAKLRILDKNLVSHTK